MTGSTQNDIDRIVSVAYKVVALKKLAILHVADGDLNAAPSTQYYAARLAMRYRTYG